LVEALGAPFIGDVEADAQNKNYYDEDERADLRGGASGGIIPMSAIELALGRVEQVKRVEEDRGDDACDDERPHDCFAHGITDSFAGGLITLRLISLRV
jgi:hypothetical protein